MDSFASSSSKSIEWARNTKARSVAFTSIVLQQTSRLDTRYTAAVHRNNDGS